MNNQRKHFFLRAIIVFLFLPLALVVGCQPTASTVPESLETSAPIPETVETKAPILEFGELTTDIEEAKWVNDLGMWKPATGIIDGEEKALTSEYFKGDTYVDFVGLNDQFPSIRLFFEWNEEGSILSQQITSRLIGNQLAIFQGDEALIGEDGLPIAPIIHDIITDEGVINGLSRTEATELSELINAANK